MSKIDFKEIPMANLADGKQDTFELFARDFFEMLGFTIEVNPDRGQDGGRDLIICEKRKGLLNTSEIKWLVSCKHKVHSGKSVLLTDETDILDRVQSHNCQGFIGFYSTIMSSGLNKKLEGLKDKCEVQIFDYQKIEMLILKYEDGINLISRYFPNSYSTIKKIIPSNLFSSYEPLTCMHCGKDLLSSEILNNNLGIIVFLMDTEFGDKTKEKYDYLYWCCKGTCDRSLQQKYSKKYISKWEDISDIKIPIQYLKWNIAIINRIRNNVDIYSDDAFDKLKEFLSLISQVVLKNQTNEEIKRVLELQMIPDFF